MVAKMIDELEIAYMSFCASYTVIMELDTKKKSRRKIWAREWLLKHVNTRRVKMLTQMTALVGNDFSINTMEKLPVKDFAGHSSTKKQKIPTFYLMAEHASFFFLRN